MIYLNAFLFCGFICLIGQIILDNTKLTAGHITTMFVVIGALLDSMSIYDRFILWAGGGAMVPITSFGHLLSHAAMASYNDNGMIGLLSGLFDLTATGITSAIIISFFMSLIFKPNN